MLATVNAAFNETPGRLKLPSILLEQQLTKGIQIFTPIGPGVAAIGYKKRMFQAVTSQGFVQQAGAIVGKVGVAASNPVQFVTGLLDALQSFIHALLVLIDTHTKRADVTERSGEELCGGNGVTPAH